MCSAPGKRASLLGKKIAIYSSLFGGYDSLAPAKKQSINVDWILFSDREIKADGWRCIKKKPMFADPRKSAKWYKINPSLVHELSDYDYLIYVDASSEILSRRFAEILICKTDVIGFFQHPSRRSILAEAVYSDKMAKYKDSDLTQQALTYTSQMGSDKILYAGGVIVRKSATLSFDAAWWNEMSTSLQDQISLPYVAHLTKTKISFLPTSQYSHILIRFNVLHRLNEYDPSVP